MFSAHSTASRSFTLGTLAAASLSCALLTGCHVTTNENGDKKNVDIGTPFGSMKVNTSNTGDTSAIGLTAYPGATPVKDGDDKDGNNADVNLSFGDFHLGVKAASFQTPDSQEKVLAFYRKDLASRYGDVISCRGHDTVGSPARTSQGLTCEDGDKNHISTSDKDGHKGFSITSTDDDKSNLELRAGSQQHQHIVGVESHDGGTKIGLVLLDLPSHLSDHNKKSEE
jgi:hypothetical protein